LLFATLLSPAIASTPEDFKSVPVFDLATGTGAASEEDEAQKVAAIRKEVEGKIPSLESLFVTTAED
jgi:hypothetical protein